MATLLIFGFGFDDSLACGDQSQLSACLERWSCRLALPFFFFFFFLPQADVLFFYCCFFDRRNLRNSFFHRETFFLWLREWLTVDFWDFDVIDL